MKDFMLITYGTGRYRYLPGTGTYLVDLDPECQFLFCLQIFKPEVGQQEIFRAVVLPRVKEFLEGQNQLLFTYGATSAGKTYTIQVGRYQMFVSELSFVLK